MIKVLVKDTGFYALANMSAAAVGFATLPFFTKTFSLEQFGVLSLVATLEAILPIVYGLQLETAYSRYFDDKNFKQEDLLKTIVKFGLLFSVPIFVIISATFFIFRAYDLIGSVALVLVLACGSSLAFHFVSLFLMVARMKRQVSMYVTTMVFLVFFSAVLRVTFVFNFDSISSYFLAGLIGNLVVLLVLLNRYYSLIRGFFTVPVNNVLPLLAFS